MARPFPALTRSLFAAGALVAASLPGLAFAQSYDPAKPHHETAQPIHKADMRKTDMHKTDMHKKVVAHRKPARHVAVHRTAVKHHQPVRHIQKKPL